VAFAPLDENINTAQRAVRTKFFISKSL